MKRIVAIQLLLIILFQCSFKTAITVSFFMNKDYIARILCINKDKPRLNCNGKCYLQKQLEKEKKSELPIPGISKDKTETIFILSSDIFHVVNNTKYTVCENEPPAIQGRQFSREIFHPPSLFYFIS